MKTMSKDLIKIVLMVFSFAGLSVTAQEATLKVEKIQASDDTTITIKKGSQASDGKIVYDVQSGTEEISSDEEYDAKKALADWKQACADWKTEFKELNKDNQILSMSCGAKLKTSEKNKVTYRSQASYKVRVKVRE